MIVSAVAMLVLAAIFLVIGILSSSLAWLVISLVATVAAAGTLYASFVHYRGRATAPAGYPDAYAADPVAQATATMPVAAPLPQSAVAASPSAATASVPAGWDDRSAAELTRVVGALSLDELHAVRRHEVEGKRRKTVVAAIDGRIDEIVEVRRSLQTS